MDLNQQFHLINALKARGGLFEQRAADLIAVSDRRQTNQFLLAFPELLWKFGPGTGAWRAVGGPEYQITVEIQND